MPARKRKRSYNRKPYARKRRSMASIIRGMAKANTQVGPYGPDADGNFNAMYGPNNAQLRKYPGAARSGDQNFARVRDRYYGPGGYWSDLGRNIGHWGTRIGGAALGGLAGLPEGGPGGAVTGALGGWEVGADISRAMGWGSYAVPRGANDLVVGGQWASQGNGSAPVYHSLSGTDEGGDVVISNRELVQLVQASEDGTFKVESFATNPADEVFHHLRQQASQYENFEFMGLMFQYVPMTGEGGSNNLGVVGMAASYDPENEREFTSLEDLLRFKGATTCKPSVGMIHGIECDPAKRAVKVMYCRDNVKRDKPFTDPATFYIASQGCENNAVLGQLWVTYSVRLRNIKPYLPKEDVELHPRVMKEGVEWLSSETVGFGNHKYYDTSIVTGENKGISDEKGKTKFTFANDIRNQQCFLFIVYHTNYGSTQGAVSIDVEDLVGCELMRISTYSGTNSTEGVVQATEKAADYQGMAVFKLRITDQRFPVGDNPSFVLTASKDETYFTMNVIHAENDEFVSGSNEKVVLY